jgi:hypothetical protein
VIKSRWYLSIIHRLQSDVGSWWLNCRHPVTLFRFSLLRYFAFRCWLDISPTQCFTLGWQVNPRGDSNENVLNSMQQDPGRAHSVVAVHGIRHQRWLLFTVHVLLHGGGAFNSPVLYWDLFGARGLVDGNYRLCMYLYKVGYWSLIYYDNRL